jgi:ABC-type dipeptide/oligopeptide/nickel transport system permease subunit
MADNQNNKDFKDIKLTSKDFEFVQQEGKIFDKKFETQPIGYFKDAMIRFSKNRTNVIATSILVLIILSSIILPIVSTKNVDELDDNFSNLPPRMPFLENFGVWDGTTTKDDQPIAPSSIGFDPENPELGLPVDYILEDDDGNPIYVPLLEDYIVPGTLENYQIACTIDSVLCVGGESVLRVDNGFNHVKVDMLETYFFQAASNENIYFNVNEFVGENAELRVYTLVSGVEELLFTITEAGEYNIDPSTVQGDPVPAFYGVRLKIALYSSNSDDYVVFDEVTFTDDRSEDPIISYTGYELSEWALDTTDPLQSGKFQRQNGEITYARYGFKNYDYTFADSILNAFPNSQYLAVVEEDFADACNPDNDPDVINDPVGMTFPDACPIKEVISKTSPVVVDGVEYFSYTVVYNYAELKGYEEIPYFLFGTDSSGRDLFTLLWVATRTSLLLGFVVATINIVIGVVYGSISGYYGGLTDLLLQRVSEVVGRIPWLVILSIMIALLGPGIQTLIFILIIQGWIGIAAITRTQFYRYKGREYVLASRTLGAKDGRLIFRHILPNGIGTIITASVLTIPFVIFNESTISFLGFGIGHGQSFNVFGIEFSGVSVGVLLADGRRELLQRPYLTIFPGILISILMITFNMFGNALRDAFNPALRGSE